MNIMKAIFLVEKAVSAGWIFSEYEDGVVVLRENGDVEMFNCEEKLIGWLEQLK